MEFLELFNRLCVALGASFSWTADPIFGMLVLRDLWNPNADDDFVQSILTAGAVELTDGTYARQQLTTPTNALDDPNNRAVWDGDPLDFGNVAGGEDYDTLVVYREVTTDADSWLMGAWDLAVGGLPRTTDGSAIELQPSIADGWFQWGRCSPGS